MPDPTDRQPAPSAGALTRRERRRARARRHRMFGAISGAALACVVIGIVAADALGPGSSGATGSGARRADPAALRRSAPSTTSTSTTTTTTVSPYPPPPPSGAGRRIVYCNSCQRVWLIEADEHVRASYLVSGRAGVPRPGTYEVERKLVNGWSKSEPSLRLPWFVGFAWGRTTDIGFHGIPIDRAGNQVQGDAQLGTYASAGCVRQNQMTARFLYDWAPMDTPVVVTP
jgi:hypothetical protein